MKNLEKTAQNGFVRVIILVIIIILVLSLFKVNLRGYIDDNITIRENLGFIWEEVVIGLIVKPIIWIYDHFIYPLVTGNLFSGLGEKLKIWRGEGTDL